MFIRYVEQLSGVPKGIRTPVAAVKGQCPRPLDDGDMLDERYSTIKNCYLYKICLFVLEFFVCTRISCVLIYLKNSKIIIILEASFQML